MQNDRKDYHKMNKMTGQLVKACEGLEEWHLDNYGIKHTAQKGSNERHRRAKRGKKGKKFGDAAM